MIKAFQLVGGTPSSFTGPSEAKSGTTYIYFEGGPLSNNDEGHIRINPLSHQNKILSFDYYAYGQQWVIY